MFAEYLEGYYKGRFTARIICEKYDVGVEVFYNWIKNKGLKTYNEHIQRLNFKNKKLRTVLVKKYVSLSNRCEGGTGDVYGYYKGMNYINIIEYVSLCNENKTIIEKLWDCYIKNENNLKFSVSIDRINEDKGYEIDNIQFVTHGFNSWKRTLKRPIMTKRVQDDEWSYFMSCTEGSRYFGIRDKTLGEVLRHVKYCNKEFIVKECSIEDALKNNNCKNIIEYYDRFIR